MVFQFTRLQLHHRQIVRSAFGMVLLAAGLLSCRRAFNIWGADFAPQYMSAKVLLRGANVYDPVVQNDAYLRYIGEVTTWAHFYPPGASVIAVPATLVSYPAARDLWFILGVVGLLAGLWHLMKTCLPGWDASIRILVLGLILCSSCVRWGFQVAQAAPLVAGLFAVFVAELRSNRSWAAFACGAVVGASKFTFGLPFILLCLAQRRLRLAASMIGFWGLLNVIGLFVMGGPSIIDDYRLNMAEFERPDQLNFPDPRGFNSLARTDWPYLLNAISPNFDRSNAIGYGLTLLTFCWLAREVWRAGDRALGGLAFFALTGPVASLSMLAVYHHHYDLGLLLVPLVLYLGTPALRRQRATWLFVIPVVLYCGAYPYGSFPRRVEPVLGDEVWITKTLACVVCILALIGTSLVTRTILRTASGSELPLNQPEMSPAADRVTAT